MTEAEALEKLKADMAFEREICFSGMRDALRLSPEECKDCGAKTPQDVAINYFKDSLKACDKMTAAFLKQFPDE